MLNQIQGFCLQALQIDLQRQIYPGLAIQYSIYFFSSFSSLIKPKKERRTDLRRWVVPAVLLLLAISTISIILMQPCTVSSLSSSSFPSAFYSRLFFLFSQFVTFIHSNSIFFSRNYSIPQLYVLSSQLRAIHSPCYFNLKEGS